jgi:AraC-like DNA-binding protein
VSLGRHVRALRLERASGLLRMSPARVTEIAEQCGYPSVYSFSRAFRTAYGCSPRAYRKDAVS